MITGLSYCDINDNTIPGEIIMTIDLSRCDIIHDMDQHPEKSLEYM